MHQDNSKGTLNAFQDFLTLHPPKASKSKTENVFENLPLKCSASSWAVVAHAFNPGAQEAEQQPTTTTTKKKVVVHQGCFIYTELPQEMF